MGGPPQISGRPEYNKKFHPLPVNRELVLLDSFCIGTSILSFVLKLKHGPFFEPQACQLWTGNTPLALRSLQLSHSPTDLGTCQIPQSCEPIINLIINLFPCVCVSLCVYTHLFCFFGHHCLWSLLFL